MEQYEEVKTLCADPLVLVEQRLDFSNWVPDGFGTGDCLIVADEYFISSTLNTDLGFWLMQNIIHR